ncbi:MAG: ferrochelatase [Deltaproteobacteria bacterium]|nr:ferrochelatase [Deltaproteobacteria bacterium]
MTAKTEKKAVLLLAFGGAESIEDVRPFVENILRERMAGRPVPDGMITEIEERYELIGGSSPLLEITRAQACALEDALAKAGDERKVYVGMRYWKPYMKDTIKDMVADGVTEAVVVIMAPQTSNAATGGYLTDLTAIVEAEGNPFEVNYVKSWHAHPLFVEAVKTNIDAALGRLEVTDSEDILIVFSLHSLPVPSVHKDKYLLKIAESITAVMDGYDFEWKLSYQSKGGGKFPWLSPATEDVLDDAVIEGNKAVVVVPLGFAADHVETLYDIDILFKDKAKSIGLNYERSASLNTSPKFIEMLAEVVIARGDA